MRYKHAQQFDYDKHGANIGTYCPLLDAICVFEQMPLAWKDGTGAKAIFEVEYGQCPWEPEGECPDDEEQFDMIVTEKGFIAPDPI